MSETAPTGVSHCQKCGGCIKKGTLRYCNYVQHHYHDSFIKEFEHVDCSKDVVDPDMELSIEAAKSNRTKCRCCDKYIAKGELRIKSVQLSTGWCHPMCLAKEYPDLDSNIQNLIDTFEVKEDKKEDKKATEKKHVRSNRKRKVEEKKKEETSVEDKDSVESKRRKKEEGAEQ